MALSRITTWNPGDVLTALALNSEFNNILSNPGTLISPISANLDMANFQLVRARVENVTTTQAAAQIGRVMFNTSDNQINVDDGSAMRKVPSIASSQINAGTIPVVTVSSGNGIFAGNVAMKMVVFNSSSTGTIPGALSAIGVTTSAGTIINVAGTGSWTIPWTTPFASNAYAVGVSILSGSIGTAQVTSISSGSVTVTVNNNAGAALSPNTVMVTACGMTS
jgi:hypothetical protein